MKKLIIAALATTVFATPALAATDTTTIGADIAAVCTIDGPNDNANLNLTSAGLQNLGNVTIQCNDPQGFIASATSSNAGVLKAAHGGSDTTYAYKLNVAGLGEISLASTQSINSETYNINDYAISAKSIAVGVKIGDRDGAPFAGDYRDTITWSITGN